MSVESIVNEQLASMDMKKIEELFNLTGSSSIFGDTSPGEMIRSILKGDPIFNLSDIIAAITNHFMHEIYGSILLGVQLVVICIVIGLLKNLSSSFSEDTISNLGVIVCSCCVMVLCLKSFMDIYQVCSNAVETMTVTMQALLLCFSSFY